MAPEIPPITPITITGLKYDAASKTTTVETTASTVDFKQKPAPEVTTENTSPYEGIVTLHTNPQQTVETRIAQLPYFNTLDKLTERMNELVTEKRHKAVQVGILANYKEPEAFKPGGLHGATKNVINLYKQGGFPPDAYFA
ncbi:MAG: hypothetical protein LBK53_01470 [Heliobacteriaceae bacterium]|jgi:hypothetical protein|nr:hypothetical protein [Heliobacteriaceae bacterium]